MGNKIQKFTVRQQMLTNNYEIYRYRDSYLNNVALHHHDFYEVYLFLNGNVNYTIESRNYHLLPGDILLISPLELHQPRITLEKHPYERIVLWVNKSFLEQFSTPHTTLTHCFDSTVPGHTNLLRLAPTPRQHVTDLMERLVAETNSADYGSDLASIGCLIQLLVELNRQAANSAQHHELTDKSGPIVTNVLNYINDHYHEELSLDMLASRFFVNKYHLSHEFNRLVGTSIYRYVIQKRLVIAKQMLSDGLPPTDVYQHCGFGDYSNFTALSRPNTASAPRISPARLKRTAQAPNKRGAGAPASGIQNAPWMVSGGAFFYHSRSWPSVSRRSSSGGVSCSRRRAVCSSSSQGRTSCARSTSGIRWCTGATPALACVVRMQYRASPPNTPYSAAIYSSVRAGIRKRYLRLSASHS